MDFLSGPARSPKLSSLREVAQRQVAVPGNSDSFCPFWLSFFSLPGRNKPCALAAGQVLDVFPAAYGRGSILVQCHAREAQAVPQPSSFTSVQLHSLGLSWKRQRLQEAVCLSVTFTGRDGIQQEKPQW